MTTIPHIFQGLLRYDPLTFSEGTSGAFVLGYRLEDCPEDLWTARFTRFKFDSDAASIEGGMRLMAHVARLVVPALGLNPDRTVFAPALHSSETHADPEGVLASMARRCAEAAGCRCLPGLLEKEPHLPTGRGCLDPEFRILLVEDAAYRSTCSSADAVFIVDDFIATGKTLSRRHRHSGPGTRHQRVRTGPGQAGMA